MNRLPPQAAPPLAALFPPGTAAFAATQPGDIADLHAAEAQHVARAAARRAGEFAAGRLCARLALRELGVENFPLEVGADRCPRWPAGIVGSITHTHGYYAAVAARRGSCRSIGVDAEAVGRVRRRLWPKICTPAETVMLERLPESEQARLGALVFSAKEAFYKCQYGLTRAWVGFHDVELDALVGDAGATVFSVRPLVPLELERYQAPPWLGRCAFEDGLVLTGMAMVEP